MKIGDKYRIFYEEGNLNNARIHILAFVDNDMVVYKRWNREKQAWRYNVEHMSWFDLLKRKGWMKKVR